MKPTKRVSKNKNPSKKQKLEIVATSPVEIKQKFERNEQVSLIEAIQKLPCWADQPIKILSVITSEGEKVLLSDLCWYPENYVQSISTPKTFVHPSRCG